MVDKKRKRKKILGLLLVILLIALLGIGIFVYQYLHFSLPADQEALDAMKGTNTVSVEETDTEIVFTPIGIKPDTGLVYYPGGQVEPESFAYAASKIADSGCLVIIQKMPYNLAMFGKDKANEVVIQHKEIKHWYLSGFSLGGVSACMTLSKENKYFEGLILYASYTTKSYDLSKSKLRVCSISGSLDGLATKKKIEDGKRYLPKDTDFYQIEGGNHTQFAIYGNGELQKGDSQAFIDRMQQQNSLIKKTIEFMNQKE